ncbi:RND transporter [Psychromonas sp. psych-6C06]|uniref:efflux RND transporter periplasmic adaptor subunit n=1 Tax=Psychromonas sp. psych-6C06 TaxID=2058089 RepID=UPI000C333C99|nr:efflux RND transporter periplasmic adaptor subunit [Psychromonas sp. psych-6C06]PKF62675.1 RND transporter [Psychromonas sp. psych-6C06]
MDIIRAPKKNYRVLKIVLWSLISLLLLVMSYLLVNRHYGQFSVQRDSLIIASVEQGDFTIRVRGSGRLLSANERWVASQVAGRVEKIYVKPGDTVQQGDILLHLENRKLVQSVETLKWQLEALTAQHKADQVALASKLLDQVLLISEAKMAYDSAKLKLEAETKLLEKGNNTISRIDYQRSQLEVTQLAKSWKNEQRRLLQMKENRSAQQNANQANRRLLANTLKRAVQDVDALQVKATLDGTVQQVPVKLGQRINIGSDLSLLSKQNELYAQLEVAESDVRQVIIGQHVNINTLNYPLTGIVSRIAPSVDQGIVLVDVDVQGELSPDARPDMSIEASITITQIDNTLFVRRPVFVKKSSTNRVYKLSDDGQFADAINVQFGQASLSEIALEAGLKRGDRVIISDSSAWRQHRTINIM